MPTFTSIEWYFMVVKTIDDLYQKHLNRPSEALGNANWLFHAREEGWDAERIEKAIMASEEYFKVHNPLGPGDGYVMISGTE